jgi:DMSO/TMAO reductase YedYZ molybdopterin-dependent catalytic subunit
MSTETDRSQLLMIKGAPFNAETPLEGLRGDLTPTELHYVRSNFDLPKHDGTLHVGGAVETPLTLTVEDLKALGEETLTVTLECAGNGRVGLMPLPTGEPWTGQAIGTATWTGVPLRAVLDKAGVSATNGEVVFTGADHGHYKGGPDIHFVRPPPAPSPRPRRS